MNIPMRREEERSIFGRTRRYVNRECLRNMAGWKCDGIQISEEVDYNYVWNRDGIHLQPNAKLWIAMIVEEWMNVKAVEDIEKTREKNKDNRP